MIINENLINVEDLVVKGREYDNIYYPIAIPQNLIDGDSYTVSYDTYVKNADTTTVLITDDMKKWNTVTNLNQESRKRNTTTFDFKKGTTTNILFYAGVAGKSKNKISTFKNIKLEKGDTATPYLPHKSKVSADKQAIFLAGGVFQEVYPL